MAPPGIGTRLYRGSTIAVHLRLTGQEHPGGFQIRPRVSGCGGRSHAVAEQVAAPGGPGKAGGAGAGNGVDVDAVVEGGEDDLEGAVAGQVADGRGGGDADAVAVVALVAQPGDRALP